MDLYSSRKLIHLARFWWPPSMVDFIRIIIIIIIIIVIIIIIREIAKTLR